MYEAEELIYATKLAAPLSAGGVFLWPLIGRSDEGRSLITLAEALESGRFTLLEIGEAGRVNELVAVNGTDEFVFLLDGEQCLGAKQNRAFNLSMIVPPGTNITVPVSCVERGRWAATPAEVSAANHLQLTAGRAARSRSVTDSLLSNGLAHSDQVEVWLRIEEKFEELSAYSPTAAEHGLFQRFASRVEPTVAQLRPSEHQVGCVYGVGARLLGFELFGRADLYRAFHDKLVRSFALEALSTSCPADPGDAEDALGLLRRPADLISSDFPAPGVGRTFRWRSEDFNAAALVDGDTCVHVSGHASVEG